MILTTRKKTEKLIELVKRKYPKVNVNYIVDYDKELYVVHATEPKFNKYTVKEPFFCIFKEDDTVLPWALMMDNMEKFQKAYMSRRVDINWKSEAYHD